MSSTKDAPGIQRFGGTDGNFGGERFFFHSKDTHPHSLQRLQLLAIDSVTRVFFIFPYKFSGLVISELLLTRVQCSVSDPSIHIPTPAQGPGLPDKLTQIAILCIFFSYTRPQCMSQLECRLDSDGGQVNLTAPALQ